MVILSTPRQLGNVLGCPDCPKMKVGEDLVMIVSIRSFIAFALLVTCTLAAASGNAASGRIYKTVDENGNVVFTDVPPSNNGDRAAITVEEPNTFVTSEALPREDWIVEPGQGSEEGGKERERTLPYRSLTVTNPVDDSSVRENAGNVSVTVLPAPDLQSGHRIRLLLDGNPQQEGNQTTFQLSNIDRGTHSLSAEIVDADGQVLFAGGASTFHLQRHSISQPRPTPLPVRRTN